MARIILIIAVEAPTHIHRRDAHADESRGGLRSPGPVSAKRYNQVFVGEAVFYFAHEILVIDAGETNFWKGEEERNEGGWAAYLVTVGIPSGESFPEIANV